MNDREILDLLRNLKFVGVIHPWRKDSLEPQVEELLVSHETALLEIKLKDPDFTLTQFKKILLKFNISRLSPEEFLKTKYPK